MVEQPRDVSRDFENAVKQKSLKTYLLRLYVTGTTPKSMLAISNIKQICQEHLKGRFELEVIDTFQEPGTLKKEQILAMPTLIKELPLPLRRIIGDLSNTERVLVGLDLREREPGA